MFYKSMFYKSTSYKSNPIQSTRCFTICRDFNVAYFNNNLNRLQVGLCEGGKRPWQKNIVLMTDCTSNSSSTVCVFPATATILHFATPPMCRIFFTSQILGDFRSHVTSLNHGPFSEIRERTLGTRLKEDRLWRHERPFEKPVGLLVSRKIASIASVLRGEISFSLLRLVKAYLRSATGDSRLTIWCGFWWAQRQDGRNKPHRCCQYVSGRGGGGWGQGVWTSHLPLPALRFPPPFVAVTTSVCFFYCEMLCQCCEIFPSSPSSRPLWIHERTQGISTVSIGSCRDFILWLC